MKRIYAHLFIVSLLILLSACGVVKTSPFGEKAFIFISTPQEVNIGKQAARQVEKKVKLCHDPVINEYIKFVGSKIAAVSDRKDVVYHFKVIESDEINAFALPGGWVYIYTGLLRRLRNEAELAFVLGHEVGHIVGRHAIRRLQLIYGIDFVLALTFGGKELSPAEREFLNLLLNLVVAGYSRKEELEADVMGAYYTGKAGWNPEASVETIKLLDSLIKFKPSGVTELFMDHPTNRKRIKNLNRWLNNFPKEWQKNSFNEERYKKKILRRLEVGYCK